MAFGDSGPDTEVRGTVRERGSAEGSGEFETLVKFNVKYLWLSRFHIEMIILAFIWLSEPGNMSVKL